MRTAAIPYNKATVSSKGQIVIPHSLREILGIHAGQEFIFTVRPDGVLELKPLTRSIDQFFGRCKRPNEAPMSISDIDNTIGQAVLKNDAKPSKRKAS